MKEFTDLSAFAKELNKISRSSQLAISKSVEQVGAIVEKKAKEIIGEYQDSIGDFPEWQELTDSTKQDRLRQGFTENDPLLRSGKLRDSMSHVCEGMTVTIGTSLQEAEWLENGTEKMPPRPFIGPAALRSDKDISKAISKAIEKAFK